MAVAVSMLRDIVSPPVDQKLDITPAAIEKLGRLRQEKKFVDAPGTSFNGIRPETLRRTAEVQLDALLDDLLQDIAAHPQKSFVLQRFSKTLAAFPSADTEDRERMQRYLEQIMHIVGIQSSNGLLNRWMYAPILGRAVIRP
jgi:hypothetical protein